MRRCHCADAEPNRRDAWRQTTATRERVNLNGPWRFRPVLPDETTTTKRRQAIADGSRCRAWPHGEWRPESGVQQVWIASLKIVCVSVMWIRRVQASSQCRTLGRSSLELSFTMLQTHARVFVTVGRAASCGTRR